MSKKTKLSERDKRFRRLARPVVLRSGVTMEAEDWGAMGANVFIRGAFDGFLSLTMGDQNKLGYFLEDVFAANSWPIGTEED